MSEHLTAQNQLNAMPNLTPIASGLLQRACACGNHAPGGGECESCKKKRLQRRAADDHTPDTAPQIVHEVLRSPGQPLDGATRAFMEPRFGQDFSRVRIHTDTQAADSARAVNALAYTVGSQIAFGAGLFAPTTATGRRLLAHELAHVVQQDQSGDGAMQAMSSLQIDSSSTLEAEADRVANQVTGDATPGGFVALQTATSVQLQRVFVADLAQVPPDLSCPNRKPGKDPSSDTDPKVPFAIESATIKDPSPAQMVVDNFHKAWVAAGSNRDVIIHGYASADGPQPRNWILSCQRAEAVRDALIAKGVPATSIKKLVVHGGTDEFKGGPSANRIATINMGSAPPPPPQPTPSPTPAPLCPAVPTSTPATCAGRNKAYSDAASCFPANPWLACVRVASADVCRAVDAFTFTGTEGTALAVCAAAPPQAAPGPIVDKGNYFLSTNRCIWGHWRAAFEAIHDLTRPVPSGLTPEWASAVAICRSKGVGSKDCCEAHVRAEQTAIDLCGPYNSSTFGVLPTDVPGAPICSAIVQGLSPGLPFTGDFGNVADRITYGNKRCCP